MVLGRDVLTDVHGRVPLLRAGVPISGRSRQALLDARIHAVYVDDARQVGVRSHHERWDGSGYPTGLAGTDISEFARIAAVADVFDAITSERPYARAAPPHVGVRAIVEGSGTAFDAAIVESFRKVVAPYPPGGEIVLSDGRRGVVVSVPTDNVELPLVRVTFDPSSKQIDPYEIDTRDEPNLIPQLLTPAA